MGEMELHSIISSGMYNCASELWLRKDSVVVDLCSICRRLRLLCECGSDSQNTEICLPYHTIVSDCLMAIDSGMALRYF